MEYLGLPPFGVGQTFGMICFVRGSSIGEANAIGPSEYVRLIHNDRFTPTNGQAGYLHSASADSTMLPKE